MLLEKKLLTLPIEIIELEIPELTLINGSKNPQKLNLKGIKNQKMFVDPTINRHILTTL